MTISLVELFYTAVCSSDTPLTAAACLITNSCLTTSASCYISLSGSSSEPLQTMEYSCLDTHGTVCQIIISLTSSYSFSASWHWQPSGCTYA